MIVPLRSDKFGLFCLYESNSPADPEDHTAREKTCFRKRILEHNGVFRAYFADEALTDAEATQALARRLVSSWIRAKPEVR